MADRVLPTGSRRSRRRATVLTLGALTTALLAGVGTAEANPGARNGHSKAGQGGDSTGAHHTDPFGYRHRDPNPLRQREHQNALREYRGGPNQPKPPNNHGDNGGASTWTGVPRADDSGWTVCRPQASWCREGR
ncbi:hypothetical protein [Nocardia bovistercoris]|uniref:Uncharacterized protein n=1 Tax=Nocardia bovistercoris TaxID=2785916 RepID=A0A931N1W5_9NOCA|nr:hypothetical protein [Nocardia bovistercoris]MBH0776122.1 hypothetical protein [Nocardia bovistercoris]